MRSIIGLFFTLFFFQSVSAFEMQGTLINNSDGTYSVTLSDKTGELHFYGNAYKQADGTLTITVTGQSNETYIGVATPAVNGNFNMNLVNNTSGAHVVGLLETEE
jgi:hypothetical protein